MNTRELHLLAFFGLLGTIIIIRLFQLQIRNYQEYETILTRQHLSSSILKAERWSIYAVDKSGKPMKLTENIDLYNVYVDPKFIPDKKQAISLISPIIYEHLCRQYELIVPTVEQCLRNIEEFTQIEILPKEPQLFYMWSGWWLSGDVMRSMSWYRSTVASIISWFTQTRWLDLISQRLDQRIFVWVKEKNYLWFIENKELLARLQSLNQSYISIELWNYVYINPSLVSYRTRAVRQISLLLQQYWYNLSETQLQPVFIPQENRYVRLINNAHPQIAQRIRMLKNKYFNTIITVNKERIPLLHGIGLEETTRRYYPYGNFMAHILWFVDNQWEAYYGVEKYFDQRLRGRDGKIVGRSSPWIGQVGTNEFDVQQVQNGQDIYLTIDPYIQREVENLTKQYQQQFRADTVSVVVMDPWSGHIKAMTNYPTFDPNDYNKSYDLQPLSPEYQYLIGNNTYIDIPIRIETWDTKRLATSTERDLPRTRKRIAKNIIWPQVFVDKNIAFPYEPWSIFKAFTVGIGIDNDEITLEDRYQDDMSLKIWPYTIANVDKSCKWFNTFLHALKYSCNVGMVRIVQRIGKEMFYNYLDKLGFWKLTNIELAWEDPWFVEDSNTVSIARFFNNAFWQWLLATPLQVAAWYSALVNGGTYVKPTVISSMYDSSTNQLSINTKKVIRQVFRPGISEIISEALFQVVDNTVIKRFSFLPWFTLGGKSWTSQIAFRGKYQRWIWWTNWSFVGIVTRDHLNYVIVVQVRRPRSNQWWEATAGKLFQEIAKFLISYDLIEK